MFWIPACLALPSTETIYHVNSFRVPCVGVAPMSCLQIQRGDPRTDGWEYFYAQIEGFAYEPGYLYRLLVRETPLPPEQVPADASSIRYQLVEVLEKTADPRLAIHDIWVLERVDDTSVAESSARNPYFEFNVVRSEYFGNLGCGDVRGEIRKLGADELELGPATRSNTLKGCKAGLAEQITDTLGQVAYWQRDGLRLVLLDSERLEVMVLRKVD